MKKTRNTVGPSVSAWSRIIGFVLSTVFMKWSCNGGTYQFIVFHFIGCVAFGWVVNRNSALDQVCVLGFVVATSAVFVFYPIGQESFSDGMPLGISGTFNQVIIVGHIGHCQHL